MPLIADPVTLRMTDDGDVDMTSGFQLEAGLAAVVNGARVRMQLFKGEWFLNQDVGVPYLERDGVTADEAILGQPFNEVKVRSAIIRALLGDSVNTGVPGLIEITKLTVAYDGQTRTTVVTWQAKTVFGDTPEDTLEV